MAKPPQLASVVIALVFVLSAACYGIVRGLTNDTDTSASLPPGFRLILRDEPTQFAWAIAVPDSPVPSGTLPTLWIKAGEPVLRNTKERATIVVRVAGPDGDTVSSINANFALGTTQLVRMVDKPLTASGKYAVAVSRLSESSDVGAVEIAEGDFTVTD